MMTTRISTFLVMGGAIVAADFVAVRILGIGSWGAWWTSNFFHTLGGAYAFFLIRAVYIRTHPYHRTITHPWMEILIFILGAVTLGVMWEWLELIVDRYRVLILMQRSVMTYADNIGDLAFDALGAIAAGFYVLRQQRRG